MAASSASSAHLPRLLVVGVGSIGERHVRCFGATGQVQVGICEPNEALRSRIAAKYQPISSDDNMVAALKHGWDSVLIATPAQTHIELARQAVAAGVKFVFLEKPLAVTQEGIAQLQAEAKAKGATLGVAYVYRAHPAVQAMRQAIQAGRFGQPVQLSIVSGQHFPFYRPAYAQTYYARHASGGGSIQDALTHLFNLAEWLVGPMTRVAALASHRVLATTEVEDTVNVLAEHGDVVASYSQNQHQPVNESWVQVVCTQGVCKFLMNQHAWMWATQPDSPWQQEPAIFLDRDDWFILQARDWLKVMSGQMQPPCTLAEALQTLRVNQAALQSATQRGAWTEVKA